MLYEALHKSPSAILLLTFLSNDLQALLYFKATCTDDVFLQNYITFRKSKLTLIVVERIETILQELRRGKLRLLREVYIVNKTQRKINKFSIIEKQAHTPSKVNIHEYHSTSNKYLSVENGVFTNADSFR